MNRDAFKDCDIRGTYPDQVNEDMFARVGREFGRLLVANCAQKPVRDMVVVGGDGRKATPALLEATIRGLAASPVGIVDLGAPLPTPAIYWAKEQFGIQASMIVTASHNPADWDGLKVMNGDRPPQPEDIRYLAEKASECDEVERSEYTRIRKVDSVLEDYKQALIQRFGETPLDRLKIVVDPGNGCMSGIATSVFHELGASVVPLFDEIDSNFSARNPDCAVAENLAVLARTVVEEGADFGVGFDGDGDRIAIVDDHGRILGSERLAMLLFRGCTPPAGRTVILDVKCSMQLERMITALGGKAHRCKSGHAYMKRMVLDRCAMMGVELSGHVFLGEIHGRDDPLYVALMLAGWLVEQTIPMSTCVDEMPTMYMTSDIRITMDREAADKLLARCASGFYGARLEHLDGVRLVWPEGWVLVRRSITEPKVSIRLEGESMHDLDDIATRVCRQFQWLREDIEAAVSQLRNTA